MARIRKKNAAQRHRGAHNYRGASYSVSEDRPGKWYGSVRMPWATWDRGPFRSSAAAASDAKRLIDRHVEDLRFYGKDGVHCYQDIDFDLLYDPQRGWYAEADTDAAGRVGPCSTARSAFQGMVNRIDRL